MGPKKKYKKKKRGRQRREHLKLLFYFYFFPLTSLFDLRKSDRQSSSGQEAKYSTQQRLRLGTKNTGFRRVFN